jgi:hypothetical protein
MEGPNRKKKFEGAKLKKIKKLEGKILILILILNFFFCEKKKKKLGKILGLGGARAPLAPM